MWLEVFNAAVTSKGGKKGNKQIEWYWELENLGLNCTLSFKTVNPKLFWAHFSQMQQFKISSWFAPSGSWFLTKSIQNSAGNKAIPDWKLFEMVMQMTSNTLICSRSLDFTEEIFQFRKLNKTRESQLIKTNKRNQSPKQEKKSSSYLYLKQRKLICNHYYSVFREKQVLANSTTSFTHWFNTLIKTSVENLVLLPG